jgi:hypothetical protein
MSGDRDNLLRSCSTLEGGLDMISRQNGGEEAGCYDDMIAAANLHSNFPAALAPEKRHSNHPYGA